MTPDEFTNKEFYIDVGDGHQLYVYDWGNPKGLPIIFLHGGPGSEVKDKYKETFDPKKHHVIFFDQRGCGKSLPYGSIEHNTTKDLVEDINKIADQVKFKQFVPYGGSWGSCMALSYALKYPKRVKSLVVYAIFTASRREADWIDKGGFRTHYPDVWDEFLARTPKAHHNDPSAYHYKNILGKNERLAHSSAMAVSDMEYRIMSLDDRFTPQDPATFDPTGTKIFAHYIVNNFFMPDRYVLDNAHKLTMPVWIVHGRYDIDCPPITAYELHNKLPHSNLIWTISNHKSEHETVSVLRTILLQLAEKK
jgi:proline iminopeptidase